MHLLIILNGGGAIKKKRRIHLYLLKLQNEKNGIRTRDFWRDRPTL